MRKKTQRKIKTQMKQNKKIKGTTLKKLKKQRWRK